MMTERDGFWDRFLTGRNPLHRHDEEEIDGWGTDKAIVMILKCKGCGQISRLVSSPYLLWPQREVLECWPPKEKAR